MNSTDKLLFDTQGIISWALGTAPQAVLSKVKNGADVFVSAVSLWEFLLKTKLHSVGISFADLQQAIKAVRATLLPIELAHLQTLEQLPFVGTHRDPFDRLIIAQAISEGYILVGADREFPKYVKTKIGSNLEILWR